MEPAAEHLFSADAGLLQLLTPPLTHAQPSAGYVRTHPPGVRANWGGQGVGFLAVGEHLAWATLPALAVFVVALEDDPVA